MLGTRSMNLLKFHCIPTLELKMFNRFKTLLATNRANSALTSPHAQKLQASPRKLKSRGFFLPAPLSWASVRLAAAPLTCMSSPAVGGAWPGLRPRSHQWPAWRCTCCVGCGWFAGLSAAYEARMCSHQHTEAQCDAQGLQFVPLVAEACGGGWGKTAMITWRTLGSLISARTGGSTSIVIEQLLQSLSVSLQRENARAVLRRLPTAAAAKVWAVRAKVRAVRAHVSATCLGCSGHMSGLSGPYVRAVLAKLLGVRVGGTKIPVLGGPK